MSERTVWMPAATLDSLTIELTALEKRRDSLTLAESERLAECRSLVRAADTQTKPNDGVVEPGMVVTVRFGATEGVQTFLFADRSVLDESRVLSPRSPLGQALSGRRVGETVAYSAPGGSLIVEIVSAEPSV